MTQRATSREARSPARGSDRFLIVDDSDDDVTDILSVVLERTRPTVKDES
jgi:hypothetical protein